MNNSTFITALPAIQIEAEKIFLLILAMKSRLKNRAQYFIS